MESFVEWLQNPWPFIIIGLVVMVLIFTAIYFLKRKSKASRQRMEDEALVRASYKVQTAEPQETSPANTDGSPGVEVKKDTIIVDDAQAYRVIVWGENGEMYFSRINKPLGNLFYADGTLPESGQTFFVTKKGDKYEAFDPRTISIESEKTPQMAYFATHWERAEGVWLFGSGFLEKLSKILMIALPVATFLIILIALGS